MLPDESKSIVQEVKTPLLLQKRVKLIIKRDDLIHPEISGNKWRKLKYNIEQAKIRGENTLLTFGGAFSNHILAVAYAGQLFGLKTIGVIRGEEESSNNPTLKLASEKGMHLHFITREAYKKKNDVGLINQLKMRFGDFYLIPEGGSNCHAIRGCQEICNSVKESFDVVCCSVGTGGTLAGLISSISYDQQVVGFSALKGDFLKGEVQQLLDDCKVTENATWEINSNYHFGGYAKFNEELINFMNDFHETYRIKTDPIYTGKLLYGVFDLIKKDYFNAGATILVLHTGGLQGIKGFNILHDQAINFD